jgi:hypothetical protein
MIIGDPATLTDHRLEQAITDPRTPPRTAETLTRELLNRMGHPQP